MAFRLGRLALLLAPAGAFELDAKLTKELEAWWGKDNYEKMAEEAKLDTRLTGITLCSRTTSAVERALRQVAERRREGGACSELPVALAMHAWRYQEEDLARCLAAPSGCRMACKDYPELFAQVSCDGANMTGSAPAGHCRHQVDSEVVDAPCGQTRALLRQIPQRWPDGKETKELVRTFWGLPFGETPERFKAPVAKKPWTGVRTSLDYYEERPLFCPDIPILGRNHDINEDCLLLHLYTPKKPAKKLRPVFIFFIPGGFTSSNWFQGGWYDAARFVLNNDCIFISLGYRSGLLGHWASEELAQEAGDNATGNYEAMDQRLALQWVQKNIKSFGGDPGAVTLAGHSSGAFSVQFHLLSPASKGLFARGILEGTALDSEWYYAYKEDAVSFYQTLGRAMGCQGRDQLRCLRALPLGAFFNISQHQVGQDLGKIKNISKWGLAGSIAEAIWSAMGFKGGVQHAGLQVGDLPIRATPLFPALPAGFVVDGSPRGLPKPPRQLYEAQEVNPAQVYLNHGTDEGTIFAFLMYAAYPWYKEPTLTHAATDEIMAWAFESKVATQYPHGRGSEAPFYRMSRAIQDSTFLCPHRRFAQKFSQIHSFSTFYAETTFAGGQKDEKNDTNWFSAVLHRDLEYFVGAWHMNQVKWIFGANDTLKLCNSTKAADAGFDRSPWLEEDELMHQLVNCRYALFMHCGSPDTESVCASEVLQTNSCRYAFGSAPHGPRFLPYEMSDRKRFVLNPSKRKPAFLAPTEEEDRLCAYWDSAKPMRFLTSACRGCDSQEPRPELQEIRV